MPQVVIDDRWVDVDFTKEPQFVHGDNGKGLFGEENYCSSYEAAVEVMSDNQIREAIEAIDSASEGGGAEDYITRIFDQGREGACVADGTTQGHQIAQAKQYGKENVTQLSAISLYKQIGRSASSGASVQDGLRKGTGVGILPLDIPENRKRFGDKVMPNTGFSKRYPDEWKETAKINQLMETHEVRSVAGIMTALCRQEPVIVGREGHCICYCRPAWKNGQYNAIYANSWSQNWGFALAGWEGGFGTDTMRQVKKSAGWAFVIRSVRSRENAVA